MNQYAKLHEHKYQTNNSILNKPLTYQIEWVFFKIFSFHNEKYISK